MNIIVFGGSGGLGQTIIQLLKTTTGSRIVNFSRSSTNPFADKNIACCASNYEAVHNAIPHGSTVIHLASQRPQYYLEQPALAQEIDLISTQNICRASIAKGARQFIFSSSGGSVYGPCNEEFISENTHLKPVHPYGKSKFHQEIEIQSSLQRTNINYSILRLANIYGFANPSRQDDLISKLACAAPNQEFTILGNGYAIRDFVHVCDVAVAFKQAINCTGQHTINIGTSIGTTCREVVLMMNHIHNLNIKMTFTNNRQHDIARNVLHIGKAREILKWSPTLHLAAGIACLRNN